MDIPLDAKVELLDGEGGHTTRVLLNPISKKIIHLIVREPGLLETEREVPIELVLDSTPKQVEAVDGRVGRIDEFLVDPVSEGITHLRMRRGHLWGRRDVTIPVDRIDYDTVCVKLNKRQVEALPTAPARA